MFGTLDVGKGVGVASGTPAPRMEQAEVVDRRHRMKPIKLIKGTEDVFIILGEL
jgi:hypothetical protein